MAKLPFLKLFTGDWLKDPRLSLCDPATRGVWIDLVCAMHELDQSGELCGSEAELARLARCSAVQLTHALTDLQNKLAADVTIRNGTVTVICRRMSREFRKRENDAERQRRHRNVTSHSSAKPEYESESDIRRVIEEYCKEIGLPSTDGTAVYDKWQGNGWTNNGKPIRDWKATIRTWKQYGYLPSQRQGGNGAPSKPFLSFQDRARRKGEIQEQLNRQFRSAQRDETGKVIWTPAEREERTRLQKELETL